jgi:hypothetical protein
MRTRLGCVLLCLLLVASNASAQSLQEQALCAKQAKAAVEEWNGSGSKLPDVKSISEDYQSHYNTKLNKCLVSIQAFDQVGKQWVTSAVLMDAFERRVFAQYGWGSRENKKYWEVPPDTCDLTPTSKDETHCSSKDEYDAFVAKYMEE